MDFVVEKAKKELFELIEKNTDLIDYQYTLSKAMNAVPENQRLHVLGTFLQYNLSDLKYELLHLKELIDQTVK
jgi:hypothetical protein